MMSCGAAPVMIGLMAEREMMYSYSGSGHNTLIGVPVMIESLLHMVLPITILKGY